MEASYVRVDATLVPQNRGNIVRIVAKCDAYDPLLETASLNANGTVTLLTASVNESPQVGQIYDVLGKVSLDKDDIIAYSLIPLPEDTNIDAACKLAHLTQKVPHMFHE